MPFEYRIYPELNTAHVTAQGCVTLDDVLTSGRAVFSDPVWKNGYNIICDYRSIAELRLSSADIQAIVRADEANEHLFDRSRCAVVAPDNLAYGLARMWESLSADSPLTTTVFREMKQACAWMRIPEDFSSQ